jgi:hypothetical protein
MSTSFTGLIVLNGVVSNTQKYTIFFQLYNAK